MDGTLSVIHFNSRSLYSNFTKMKEYLRQFTMFNVIAVSETWLSNEKGADVELEGYELFATNRTNKKGGGVALFVNNDLRCKIVKTITIENVMECVTVEINVRNLRI